jgi:hypothetical protein
MPIAFFPASPAKQSENPYAQFYSILLDLSYAWFVGIPDMWR